MTRTEREEHALTALAICRAFCSGDRGAIRLLLRDHDNPADVEGLVVQLAGLVISALGAVEDCDPDADLAQRQRICIEAERRRDAQ